MIKKFDNEKQNIGAFADEVLAVRRVSAKRVGGSKFHFSVLSVVGDRSGQIGVAVAKSKENANAIQKSKDKAKRNLFRIPLTDTRSIPHEVYMKDGPAVLYLRPAPLGSGIIAGGVLRTILEYAGINNVSVKVIGTDNAINNAYALVSALKQLRPTKKMEVKNE
jgi:small subunit ribosomal protein S5